MKNNITNNMKNNITNNMTNKIKNKSIKKSGEKGFSLIELSIVLIVIGLLVAGITAGKSLMDTASNNAIITDVNNMEKSLYVYYIANRTLPGINDEAKISFSNPCGLWKDLKEEKILNIGLPYLDSCNKFEDSEKELSKENTYTRRGYVNALGYNEGMDRHTLFLIKDQEDTDTLLKISHLEDATITKTKNAIFSNQIASNIDRKVDDGLLDKGKVQAFSATSNGNKECTYNILDKGTFCSLSFAISGITDGIGYTPNKEVEPFCTGSSLSSTNATFPNKEDKYKINKSETGKCNTGYTGTITATCINDNEWSYSDSCIIKTCSTLSVPEDENLSSTEVEFINYNQEHTFSCATNYSGTVIFRCTEDITWEKVSGSCSLNTCDNQSPPSNNLIQGSATAGTTNPESSFTFSCITGYYGVGATYNCLSTGSWNTTSTSETDCKPFCKKDDLTTQLSSLPSINENNITLSNQTTDNQNYQAPATATLQCNTNYSQATPSTAICQNDGTWTITNNCFIQTCNNNDLNTKKEEIINANDELRTNNKNTNAFKNAIFPATGTTNSGLTTDATGCETGYTSTQNIKMKCEAGNWKWDASNDSIITQDQHCVILTCDIKDLFNNTEILGGYDPLEISKNNVLSVVKCTNNTCSELGTNQPITITDTTTEVLEIGQYLKINTCNTGYELRGVIERIITCNSNKKFEVYYKNNTSESDQTEKLKICIPSPVKCWSSSGGKTNLSSQAGTVSDGTIYNSYLGFIDTECCSGTGSKYVNIDDKLYKTLHHLNQNEDLVNFKTRWEKAKTEEKLIKIISLYNTSSSQNQVDLKCMNLSSIDLTKDIESTSPIKKISGYGNFTTYIQAFNEAVKTKSIFFSYRPVKYDLSNPSTLNDGSNLSNANFSGAVFTNDVYFGSNRYSSGNPGSNLTNANFSGSSFSYIYFGYNRYSSGNPGSNLTGADFSGSSFNNDVFFGYNIYSSGNPGSNLSEAKFQGSSFGYLYFGYNGNSSTGNPSSNLSNANFSGSSFGYLYFGYNGNSSGNPGSNLSNADFSGSSFSNYVYFGYNNNSSGNPGSNLSNADFSGSSFSSIVYFGYNYYSSGNPGSNLNGATFGNCIIVPANTRPGQTEAINKCANQHWNGGSLNTSNITIIRYIQPYLGATSLCGAKFYLPNNNTLYLNMTTTYYNLIDSTFMKCPNGSTELSGKNNCLNSMTASSSCTNAETNVVNPYCNANPSLCCKEWDTCSGSACGNATCKTYEWNGTF